MFDWVQWWMVQWVVGLTIICGGLSILAALLGGIVVLFFAWQDRKEMRRLGDVLRQNARPFRSL